MPDLDLRLERPIDLRPILALHVRGPGDPTFRLARSSAWRATRTPDGPATVEIRINGRADGAELVARGWGPGAHSALEDVPALVGLLDDPSGFEPDAHPVVRDLARRMPNLRIGRTNRVMEALVPAILEQKVTGIEASRAFRALVLAHGEPAPGPVALGLRTPPAPAVLAGLPYHAYHPFGIEARRADTIRRVAARAGRLERLADLPPGDAARLLRTLPGIGPWTAAEVTLRALGDADAVSVGDFHTKHLVSFALAGEPRGTDERMLELLAPFAGHRGRVVRLLELSGIRVPRRGPRMAPRAIAGI